MIQVKRTLPPPFYKTEAFQRMENELLKRAGSSSQERLKFNTSYLKQVRPALRDAFNNKCAYCESKLGITTETYIDNFRPKQMGPSGEYGKGGYYYWLAYDWNNLYAACASCTTRKGNAFPMEEEATRCRIGAKDGELRMERYSLIDPCTEDPRSHLEFSMEGWVKGRSRRGETTIKILGLNRDALVLARREEAFKLAYLLEEKAENPFAREEMVGQIKDGRSALPYLALLQEVIYLHETSRLLEGSDKMFNPPPVIPPNQALPGLSQFSIRRIEILNFRTIKDLVLDIVPENEDNSQASWLLLLGDNGVGKSTVLQAVALTLAGRAALKKLKIEPAELLYDNAELGSVRIFSYEQDEPVELKYNYRAFLEASEQPVTYLSAYGATRNLPKHDDKKQKLKARGVNIANLFDYTAPLTDPEVWLSALSKENLDHVFTALFDLLELRDDDSITYNGQFYVTRAGHTSSLRQLSDGYRTMLAMACDVMAAFSNGNESYHLSKGIVLIDELGNHLHPRWRIRVVNALRIAFPMLQFIVSTHEPLCLRGLRHGEVVVLMRDQQHQVRKLDKSLLPDHSLMRVDQLLTSDLFGLLNTLDEETEHKYEDYYALLQQPPEQRSPEVREQISVLSEELVQKEIVGATPPMQALYAVVNETYAKNLREEGFKTKTQLKEKTISDVRELINKKQLDWL